MAGLAFCKDEEEGLAVVQIETTCTWGRNSGDVLAHASSPIKNPVHLEVMRLQNDGLPPAGLPPQAVVQFT